MAPAIWRTVFVTAEPALTSSGSRQFSDHVVIGMSTNPMPIWRTNCQIDTHQIHEVMEIRLIMMVPNSRVIEPISATGPRAETVECLAAEELRDALAERAGQHHQAADRGGIASAILNRAA